MLDLPSCQIPYNGIICMDGILDVDSRNRGRGSASRTLF